MRRVPVRVTWRTAIRRNGNSLTVAVTEAAKILELGRGDPVVVTLEYADDEEGNTNKLG